MLAIYILSFKSNPGSLGVLRKPMTINICLFHDALNNLINSR